MEVQPIPGSGMTRKERVLMDTAIGLPPGTRILVELLPLTPPAGSMPHVPMTPELLAEMEAFITEIQGYPCKLAEDNDP